MLDVKYLTDQLEGLGVDVKYLIDQLEGLACETLILCQRSLMGRRYFTLSCTCQHV